MPEQTPYSRAPGRDWLAALLLRRQSRLLPRFAAALIHLRAAPRAIRRRLHRRAAVSLAGAALLLALAGSPLLVPLAQAATITVADGEIDFDPGNGDCSLIEAINNANNNNDTSGSDCVAGAVGADTVALPAGGTFDFAASVGDYGGNTGLPQVTSEIILSGNGSTFDNTTAADLRFLAVAAAGDLTVDDLTLQNGSVSGGSNGGGAIFSDGGALTVTDSRFYTNSGSSGGAIFSDGGTLDITDSTFSGNDGFRGGAFTSYGADVTVTTTTISGNDANRNGGGINARGGSLAVIDSIISGNGPVDYGGGIFADEVDLTITRSTIDGNTANSTGGGLAIEDGVDVTISQSAITNNSAGNYGDGGGIVWGGFGDSGAYPTTGSITNTTISGNAADYGGGILVVVGELTLNNVTISDNTAEFYGGGVFVDGSATLDLNRAIISGNAAASGAEVYVYSGTYGTGTVTANNFNLLGHSGLTNGTAFVNFTPGATDITATSLGTQPTALAAILAPLADNGGPTTPATETHALVAGSPAIDRAPSAACTVAPVSSVDQRDVARPQEGNGAPSSNECDIGAYEYVGAPPVGICPAPDNQLTTILGVGMGDTRKAKTRAKLTVPNAGNLIGLYGQLAGKDGGRLPRRGRFQYPNGSYVDVLSLTGTAARSYGIYWYGTELEPAASIRGRWFLSPGTRGKVPRAFILYATHATTVPYFDNYVVYPDGHTNMVGPEEPWSQVQTLSIPIDPPLGPADVTVQVALVDNDNDNRAITVIADAGGVDDTDVSFGPTHGALLNLITLTLPDVPVGTTEVTIELRSSADGDSAAVVGAAASYPCNSN